MRNSTLQFYRFIFLFFLYSLAFQVSSHEFQVRYVPEEVPNQPAHDYYVSILNLALEKTVKEYGEYKLVPLKYYLVQHRAVQSLENNQKLDIYWTMTSKQREEKLRPIRVPLLKGLLGLRVFIIRQGEQNLFTDVERLNDLQKLVAGQGEMWPDTTILRENNLNVLGSSDYHGVFTMLDKRRVDYFPRGIHEPWSEIKEHHDKNFAVEQKLLLQYQAPVYFFVNKNNRTLAERIERGLQIAIEDGTFDQYFNQYTKRQKVFDNAKIHTRRILKLKNPLLTDETPVKNKKLWLPIFH